MLGLRELENQSRNAKVSVMNGGRIAVFATGLTVIALLGWLWRGRTPDSPSSAPVAAHAGANIEAAREGLRATPPDDAPAVAAAHPGGSKLRPRDPGDRARARQSADAARARLRTLQAQRDSERRAGIQTATAAAAPATMPAPEGSGNQVGKPLGEYVQGLLNDDFIPMGQDCYKELLERSPDAAGSMKLKVVVTGDPSVGGVVDNVEVASKSGFSDESLETCIRESMYSLQFDAPPPGHPKMDFTYPLDFSPYPPDGGH
jgi:hypothetical protein